MTVKTNDFRPRWDKKLIPLLSKLKEFSVEDQFQILQNSFQNLSQGNNISVVESQDKKSIESKLSCRIKTLDKLMEVCKVDENEWMVERHIINKWEVGSQIDGQIVVEELFQVKVWLKRNKEFCDAQQVKQDILEEIKTHSPKIPKLPRLKNKSKHLLEVNVFDLHFGKLAQAELSGEDYDTDIAEKRFLFALHQLVERTGEMIFERILFPIGNDFYNSDSLRNTTTKGTPQDEHLLWQQTIQKGRRLMQKGIDYLSQFAPVDVVVIQGNHDWERMFMLGEMLEGFYHNNENIEIDNGYSPRKYYQYGKCLIGLTHGNNEKVIDLPLIMAQECSEQWNKTKFREFHIGHLHHTKNISYKSSQEFKGIVVRYLRSLSANDTWHHIKGYLSQQSAEAFLWHKEQGLIAQYSVTL